MEGLSRKLRRFSSATKARNKPPSTSPESTPSKVDEIPAPVAVKGDYGDRERAIARYREAAKSLKKSIENLPRSWGSFMLPELAGDPADFDDEQFRNQINLAIASREPSIRDRNSMSKCRNAIEYFFTALSPFAKNFLIVAKEIQSVSRPMQPSEIANHRCRYLFSTRMV